MVNRFGGLRRILALGLILTSGLGAFGWFRWCATRRADINFLPALRAAEWIVYPSSPQTMGNPRLSMSTVFRRSFTLQTAPAEAALRVAGLHGYALSVNGIAIEQ